MKSASPPPKKSRPFPIFSSQLQKSVSDVDEMKENISEDDSKSSAQEPEQYEVEKILSHRRSKSVITDKTAEERGKAYDAAGATYLFDLDFNDSTNVEFAVDAKEYGNVAHFINHSCKPSLQLRAVWIECLDERMPRLALFSRRAIEAGEELTFNYRMHDSPSSETVDEEANSKTTKIPCLCGAPNCRKYLN